MLITPIKLLPVILTKTHFQCENPFHHADRSFAALLQISIGEKWQSCKHLLDNKSLEAQHSSFSYIIANYVLEDCIQTFATYRSIRTHFGFSFTIHRLNVHPVVLQEESVQTILKFYFTIWKRIKHRLV